MNEHELDALLKELAEQDESAPLPESFQSGWREAIKEEARIKTLKKPMWRSMLATAAALVFLVGGTLMTLEDMKSPSATLGAPQMMMSRGVNVEQTEATYDTVAGDQTYGVMANMAMKSTAPAQTGKKIIQTLDVTLRTTEFEQDMERVKELCASLEGWVEYAWQSGDTARGEMRRGEMTLRIPTHRLEEIRGSLKTIGRLTALTESARDVTASYQDNEARLNTQKAKMERLQTMLAEATQMSDLIELEAAIADTQYMIDSYESQLRDTDRQVDYTAVNVTLREEASAQTAQESSVPLTERIGAGLKASVEAMGEFFQAMAVFLIAAAPWLATLAVVLWVIRLIRKKRG